MNSPITPPPRDPLQLAHHEFVAAYCDGTITVNFDAPGAARFLSARLLLPLFILPVLGIGVGLALTGRIWIGLTVMALGIIVPRMIKRSAPHFLTQQALSDENLYRELLSARIMQIVMREHA